MFVERGGSVCKASWFSHTVCPLVLFSTCFNRIDLPLYESREELKEKLKLAVTMVATGFDIE